MSNIKNKVQLIGHLGKDPEIKTFDSNKTMAKFSLATSDSYRNSAGERVTETYWHNIVVWGKTAEFVEKYVKKGHEVAIEGKLTSRSYDDKNGDKKYITEIVVNELVLLTKKEKAEA